MSIVNLPFEIFDLFIVSGENKIEKRKIYYILIFSIKQFGLKTLNKEIFKKYYEKLSFKQFQFMESVKNEISPGKTPNRIVHIFGDMLTTAVINHKKELAANFAINMYEYLTLTKDGLDLVSKNNKFEDTILEKFLDFCGDDIFFNKIFTPCFSLKMSMTTQFIN